MNAKDNSPQQNMVKSVNQVLVFILEIIMFIAFGYFGFARQWNLIPKLLLTIFIITTAVALWAVFAAPKSGHRLEMPYLAIFRATMFLLAAFLLFRLDYRNLAIALAALAIVTQIISFFTEK